jgi:hypothetical protein
MRQRTRHDGAEDTSSEHPSNAEQQPLLSTNAAPKEHDEQYIDPLEQTRPSSTGCGSLALLALIAAYGVTMLLVNWSFFKLPPSKPLDAAGQSSEFSGDAAWYHLEQFASKPHPINSRENDVSRTYLENELHRLQKIAVAAGRAVKIDFEDRAVYYNSDITFDADMAGIPRNVTDAKMGMFYHSRNLLLRFPGVETNKSILFSAHYGNRTIYNRYNNSLMPSYHSFIPSSIN